MHAYFQNKGLLDLKYAELRQRLWNCDETASVAIREDLVKRETRVASEVCCGSGREYITTLFCGSAIGERLPPYVVYKAETNKHSWTVGCPQIPCAP